MSQQLYSFLFQNMDPHIQLLIIEWLEKNEHFADKDYLKIAKVRVLSNTKLYDYLKSSIKKISPGESPVT